MYKLYNVKAWGSLAIHCMLEDMEVPYTNIWMTPEQVKAPEFREISPLALIPALGLSDGQSLYESAAIVSFLVAAHPDKQMSPELGSPAYGEFMSLLHLMSTEMYPAVDLSHPSWPDDNAIAVAQRQKLDMLWMLLEKRLSSAGPWLMGKDYSALDPYAFMLGIWYKPSEQALYDKYPAVAKLAADLRARPKLKAVLESHGVLAVT